MAMDLPNIPSTSYEELKQKQSQKGFPELAYPCIGIIHLSRIPPGMPPSFARKYFEDYGVKRVYFAPEGTSRSCPL